MIDKVAEALRDEKLIGAMTWALCNGDVPEAHRCPEGCACAAWSDPAMAALSCPALYAAIVALLAEAEQRRLADVAQTRRDAKEQAAAYLEKLADEMSIGDSVTGTIMGRIWREQAAAIRALEETK